MGGPGLQIVRCLKTCSLVVGLLVVVGCSAGSPTESTKATVATPALTASRGTFQAHVMLTGELQSTHADKIIVPRTPTWQMPIRWMIEDGAAVVAGQKVIELDNSQFSGELEQKRLQEDGALNQLNQKQADLAVELLDKDFAVAEARIRLEKARLEATVPQDLMAQRDYQERALAKEKAEIDLQKAQEERAASHEAADSELEELRIALDRARFDVKTAEDAIASLTLYAPRDGILVVAENGNEGRKFQVGDNVYVGLAVMEIPDLGTMRVAAQLSDVDDGQIAVGMRASCALDTYPDRFYEGTVSDISPVATEQGQDSSRRAFRVVIDLDSADAERMRPGMSARAEVRPEPQEGVLLVARAAIDPTRSEGQVRLASGETVTVTLGPCNAQHCVVVDGLDDGTRLWAAR